MNLKAFQRIRDVYHAITLKGRDSVCQKGNGTLVIVYDRHAMIGWIKGVEPVVYLIENGLFHRNHTLVSVFFHSLKDVITTVFIGRIEFTGNQIILRQVEIKREDRCNWHISFNIRYQKIKLF